jgi:hypothetical protein
VNEYSTTGMTFGQLKRLIVTAEAGGTADSDVVIIARDSEGNAFGPLATWSNDAIYVPSSAYAGELEHWDEDDVEDLGPDRPTWSEWYGKAQDDGGLRCVVLWPIN